MDGNKLNVNADWVELNPLQHEAVTCEQQIQANKIRRTQNQDGSYTYETDSDLPEARELVRRANAQDKAALKDFERFVFHETLAWEPHFDGTNAKLLEDNVCNAVSFEGMQAMFGEGVTFSQAQQQVRTMVQTTFARTRVGDPMGDKMGITDLTKRIDKTILMRHNAAGRIVRNVTWNSDDTVKGVKDGVLGDDLRAYYTGKGLAEGMQGRGMAFLEEMHPDDYKELQGLAKDPAKYREREAELYEEHARDFAKWAAPELREMAKEYDEKYRRVCTYELARRLGLAAAARPGQELDFNEQHRIVNAVLAGVDGGEPDSELDDPFHPGEWLSVQSEQDSERGYYEGLRARRDPAGEERHRERLEEFKDTHRIAKESKEAKAKKERKPLDMTAATVGSWKCVKRPGRSQDEAEAYISVQRYEELKRELSLKPGDKLYVKLKTNGSRIRVASTYKTQPGDKFNGVQINSKAAVHMAKRGKPVFDGDTGDADVRYYVERASQGGEVQEVND